MAKVHLVDKAQVHPAKFELDGATPIVPMRAVVLRVVAPTTDEWPIPSREGDQFLAFHPELAREIAEALVLAAREVE